MDIDDIKGGVCGVMGPLFNRKDILLLQYKNIKEALLGI